MDLLHGRTLGWAVVSERAWRNVRFLRDAFDPEVGTFRNFRRADGSWIDGTPSEDSQGRAMLALGTVVATSPDGRMVALAASLFTDALPEAVRVTALRAQASVLLGCDAAIRVDPTDATDRAYRMLARRLHSAFTSFATDDAWPWPEPILTYENGLLPRALIVAGRWLASTPMIETGRRALDWLIDIQTGDGGGFSPSATAGGPATASGRGSTSSRSRRPPCCSPPKRRSPSPATSDISRRWNAATGGSSAATTSASRSRIRRAAPASMASRPTGSTRTRAPSRR